MSNDAPEAPAWPRAEVETRYGKVTLVFTGANELSAFAIGGDSLAVNDQRIRLELLLRTTAEQTGVASVAGYAIERQMVSLQRADGSCDLRWLFEDPVATDVVVDVITAVRAYADAHPAIIHAAEIVRINQASAWAKARLASLADGMRAVHSEIDALAAAWHEHAIALLRLQLGGDSQAAELLQATPPRR